LKAKPVWLSSQKIVQICCIPRCQPSQPVAIPISNTTPISAR
jgi:hypothetical protein